MDAGFSEGPPSFTGVAVAVADDEVEAAFRGSSPSVQTVRSDAVVSAWVDAFGSLCIVVDEAIEAEFKGASSLSPDVSLVSVCIDVDGAAAAEFVEASLCIGTFFDAEEDAEFPERSLLLRAVAHVVAEEMFPAASLALRCVEEEEEDNGFHLL